MRKTKICANHANQSKQLWPPRARARSQSLKRPKDKPPIGIIYRPWPTKTSIMMALRLIGFKLLSTQGFYFQVTVILTFYLLTPKSIGIIYWSWLVKTQIMVNLSLIGFEQVIELQITLTLTFDLLTLKSIGIIWVPMGCDDMGLGHPRY